jgi:hypothetical protein
MRRRRLAETIVAIASACALVVALPGAAAAQPPDERHDQMGSEGPQLFIRAFGAVDWSASQLPNQANTFNLGQFTLFLTSSLNEHVSVLAEAVMEPSGATTRVVTDLERLQLTYRASDWLEVSAGRYHTGLGYYNAAFHHTPYFETLIGRPRIFAFEDEGGVLPVHEIGLSARGAVPKTGGSLKYLAEVGNGRTWNTADERPQGGDQNDGKSTNLGLSFRPARWGGLEAGGSFYRDVIPRGSLPLVEQRIAAAYLVFRTPSSELMTEWLGLWNGAGDGRSYASQGGYFQASTAFDKLRPYYRYDRQAIAPGSPLIGEISSYKANIGGLRFDPAEWIGLKLQYEWFDEAGLTDLHAVRTQLVFVF